MQPPELSDEQRFAALAKAAEARRVRAETKVKLKLGLLSFDALMDLADTQEMVAAMKTLTALESMPGLGKVRSRRLMEQLGISQNRRLRGLGRVQRSALSQHFADASDASA